MAMKFLADEGRREEYKVTIFFYSFIYFVPFVVVFFFYNYEFSQLYLTLKSNLCDGRSCTVITNISQHPRTYIKKNSVDFLSNSWIP